MPRFHSNNHVPHQGLWPIAMLRIAMELKRPGAPDLEQIVEDVVRRLGIEKGEFESYLAGLGLLSSEVKSPFAP